MAYCNEIRILKTMHKISNLIYSHVSPDKEERKRSPARKFKIQSNRFGYQVTFLTE